MKSRPLLLIPASAAVFLIGCAAPPPNPYVAQAKDQIYSAVAAMIVSDISPAKGIEIPPDKGLVPAFRETSASPTFGKQSAIAQARVIPPPVFPKPENTDVPYFEAEKPFVLNAANRRTP